MTQWSLVQEKALKAVDAWYKNRRKEQQVFRLFGVAGTGKTTLAKHFAENVPGIVKFATFTGKAAHVMAQKGCVGASTIHRLIYVPKMTSKNRLRNLEKEIQELEALPKPWSEAQLNQKAKVKKQLQEERQNAGRVGFSLNLDSTLREANLLIVDEVSMLDATIGRDLESFGVPILVLGDPEQLPPVYGTGYFIEQPPDIMLTEIHRQALDNPIIKISQLVREGGELPLGNYGESKVVDGKLPSNEVLDYDMILTGLRKTKRACDERCRNLRGYSKKLPEKNDRIMCIRNDHTLGILNGQIFTVQSDSIGMGDGTVSIHIKDSEMDMELAVIANEKPFLGQSLEKWEWEQDIQEFEYAYAITVHKAQGSQWDNVLLFDQKNKFNNWSKRDKQRWLYTGITRAAEKVTVVRL